MDGIMGLLVGTEHVLIKFHEFLAHYITSVSYHSIDTEGVKVFITFLQPSYTCY